MKSRRVANKPANKPVAFLGHRDLGTRLAKSLTDGSLPPVMIFAGPTGVGKSTAAEWLIRMDRCREKGRPCEDCVDCLRATAGKHEDVTILAGQADEPISIETVREALQKYQHRPMVTDRSRWLLIKNAEWLSNAAVSALLKFLEEPPPATRVILTTANPNLIPRTICSRSAMYRWHLIPSSEWNDISASREAQARAAGRPGWLEINQDQEQLQVDEILSVLNGQPMPGAWLKLESEEGRRLLATFELVVRDVLLEGIQAESRLLWPHRRATYQEINTRVERNHMMELLNRLGDRPRQLRRHVAPRLLIQDAMAYA